MRLRLVPYGVTLLSFAVLSAFADSQQQPLNSLSLAEKANAFLSSGQFSDAVRAYSEAIEHSPLDYVLYYKRATAYYSLARHQPALHDFDKVLEITSGSFDKALLMKTRVHVREGEWTAARDSLKKYLGRVKGDASAKELLQETSEGEAAARKAGDSSKAGNNLACIDAASDALKVASHSAELRILRADCALAAGDIQQAVGDLIRLTHITPASTDASMRIAHMSYFLLPPSSQAQSALKQCLHFDPDSSKCAKLHKTIKKLDKAFEKLEKLRGANDWRGIVNHVFGSSVKDSPPGTALAGQIDEELKKLQVPSNVHPLRISERRKDAYRAMCQAYVKLEQPKRAEWWCEELLRFEGSSEDVDGLVGRGEVALTKEQWEEAVRAFEKAFEQSGRSSQDVMKRLQRAQKLLKQSRQKDYYKVLGVSRDADERTIKKAYRKAAKTAHPDKGGSEEKMATVNEAYEVLSNPELRARFDNGDDPNDPSGGQPFQQGGNPFGGGGNPFAQFFSQGRGGGFQQQAGGGMPFNFHFSHGGAH